MSEKSYAEFSGNSKLKDRKFYSNIKKGITNQEAVKRIFGNPTKVIKLSGGIQWHYEYKVKIFGTNFNGIIDHTLDIGFDDNNYVINVFGGGGAAIAPNHESPYGEYYTL